MFEIGFGTALFLGLIVYLIERHNDAQEDREAQRQADQEAKAAENNRVRLAESDRYPSWMTESWK
jgi:hypothetical protein